MLALNCAVVPSLEVGVPDDVAWASTKSGFLEACFGVPKSAQEWQFGAVYCLECSTAECEHAKPSSSDGVFDRYTPNGKLIFRPMLDILLEQSPTLGEQLYRGPSKHVGFLRIQAQQADPLLKELRDGASVRVEAILHLGFLQSRRIHKDKRCAISILLLKEKGLYRLHQVGIEQTLFEHLAELPDNDHIKALNESLIFARRKLKRLRRKKHAGVADQKMSPVTVLRQLGTAMRRISTKHRGRTEHAKVRHAQGDRSTGEALKDGQSVGATSLLVDERRQTWVVIGKRGPAHCFAATVKHVMSIRLETGEIERKKGSGRWRMLDQDALNQFCAMFETK